jgi:hypothetical protein
MQADLTAAIPGTPIASLTIQSLYLDLGSTAAPVRAPSGYLLTLQNGAQVSIPLSPAVAQTMATALQNGITNHLGAFLGTPLKNIVP